MTTCLKLTEDMLPNRIPIQFSGGAMDMTSARRIADQKAAELAREPMLLAWYEGRSGRFSPKVECCSDHKPGWIVYAESRGGDISIDINDQEYVFIYRDVTEDVIR